MITNVAIELTVIGIVEGLENGMSFDWNRRGWWLAAPAVAAAAGALVPSHGLLIVAAMAGAGLAVFAAPQAGHRDSVLAGRRRGGPIVD
ncbi:hypothetical protein GS532_22540 [Rhodococcus hoagii]|nr:hypothetical protein [Prescottella equi]